MARRVVTISQNDFAFGQVREDARDRDDVDLIRSGLRKARNCEVTATGRIAQRRGTSVQLTGAGQRGGEIDFGDGERYMLDFGSGTVGIYAEGFGTATSVSGAPWSGDEYFWIVTDQEAEAAIIGARNVRPQVLAKGWTLTPWQPSNPPYFNFESGVTIQPSGYTGAITLTASASVFKAGHVGEVFRYVNRQIQITAVTSPTQADATVLQRLPPTKPITVQSSSGFLVGEAVEEATLGGQGVITQIAGNVVTVLVTKNWDGWGSGNTLVGPSTTSQIVTVGSTTPAATVLWDEPMMSSVRGYPGSATVHGQRLVLTQFPQAPRYAALSVAGVKSDFRVGADDDDAIIESIGADDGGEIYHAVSAEDLLFLGSKGVYYEGTRDGGAITPTSFAPRRFDRAGANNVPPAVVDDGCIFVGANGRNVLAAFLSGDQYRAWTAATMTDYEDGVVKTPKFIAAPSDDSDLSDRFAYITNSDGTIALVKWERGPRTVVGWFPWDTLSGEFRQVFQCFGDMHAIVERGGQFQVERFDPATYVDADSGSALGHGLANANVVIWEDGRDFGDFQTDGAGLVIDPPSGLSNPQTGLPIIVEVVPWPRRAVEHYGTTRNTKRVVMFIVSVLDTVEFKVNGAVYGGYRAGDNLSLPPPPRNEEFKIGLFRDGHYEKHVIVHDRPGPFGITSIKQKVTL